MSLPIINYIPGKGMSIYQASQEAIARAIDYQSYVHFLFNEISIEVHPNSFVDDIVTIYDLRCQLRRARNLLPI